MIRSAFDTRRALFAWTVHREHHDDDGEPMSPAETDHGDGRLAEVAEAVERLGAVEPSCSPLGEGPDGDGYSPWLSAEPEPDYCRGGWTRETLHVVRIRRDGRRVPAGPTTLRRILRAAGVTVR